MDSADRRQAHKRAHELWEAGQARLREMEDKWRREHEHFRQQVRESKDRLSEAKRQHVRERQEARKELRQELDAARRS